MPLLLGVDWPPLRRRLRRCCAGVVCRRIAGPSRPTRALRPYVAGDDEADSFEIGAATPTDFIIIGCRNGFRSALRMAVVGLIATASFADVTDE